MLKKPEVHVEKILELANFIEALPPEQFDMAHFECGTARCIAGWALHLDGQDVLAPLSTGSSSTRARDLLGIDGDRASDLFFSGIDYHPTTKEAARVLRHLAITGEVDWTI